MEMTFVFMVLAWFTVWALHVEKKVRKLEEELERIKRRRMF